jgi:hypothetical protein
MPSIPEIPGKGLIAGTTKRAKVLAGSAVVGAVAAGGFVARRVLGHGGGENGAGASADPIAETPTAPPGSEDKPVPKAKPAKPKAAPKPKARPTGKAKPAAAAGKPTPVPKPKPAAPAKPAPGAKAKPSTKPVEPKAPAPKAAAKPKAADKPKATPSKAPVKPRDPHHELDNPVVDDPDLTEFPDPYDTREDPRDPADPDGKPFGEEPHPQTGAESTSEPPLSQDPTVERGGKPPQCDKLDD